MTDEQQNQPAHASSKEQPDTEWSRDVLSRLAFSALNEQRRARRWSIFFRALLFAYLFLILFLIFLLFDGGFFHKL